MMEKNRHHIRFTMDKGAETGLYYQFLMGYLSNVRPGRIEYGNG